MPAPLAIGAGLSAFLAAGGLQQIIGGGMKLAALRRQRKDAKNAEALLEEAKANLEEAEATPAPQVVIDENLKEASLKADNIYDKGEEQFSKGLSGSQRAFILNQAFSSRPYGTTSQFGYNNLMNRMAQGQGVLQAGKTFADMTLQGKQLGADMMSKGGQMQTSIGGIIQKTRDATWEKQYGTWEKMQEAAGDAYATALENQQKARNEFTKSMAGFGQGIISSKGGAIGEWLQGYLKGDYAEANAESGFEGGNLQNILGGIFGGQNQPTINIDEVTGE